MHVPLVVVLQTERITLPITKDVRELTFKSSVPGGFASCQVSLDRPLTLQPDEITYFGNLYVYDGRNGTIVWDGYLEDPGRGVDADGQIWELTAIGPAGHAQDFSFPVVYVDRRLADPWQVSSYTEIKNATIENADEQVAAIKILIPRGTVVVTITKDVADIIYQEIREAGQTLARISFTHISGITNTSWRVRCLTRFNDDASPGSVIDHQTWTTAQSASAQAGDTNFDLTHNAVNLRMDRDDTNVTVPDDDTWVRFYQICVRGRLKDVYGVDITNNEDFEDSQINFVYGQGSSNLPWIRSTATAQGGNWSMSSGKITHNQTTDMVIQVPPWANTLRFGYRVDSEINDKFRFLIDGTEQFNAGGNVAWTNSAVYSVSTAKTVTFRYTKDAATSGGGDRAFVDNVAFYGNYSTDSVVASDIVKDVLGRALPLYDGPNASIETTSYAITQLQFMDGATAEEILNEVLELEPNMYWAAWERDANRTAVVPATMSGPEFNAATYFVGTATGDFSWTHLPKGNPQGILVLIVQNAGITDEVNGVTYGGVAMTEVPLSPLIHSTGTEDGVVYGYFLGENVPSGPQTVLVDVNGTGSAKDGVCFSVVSNSTTTEIEITGTLDSGGIANPSVTLSTDVPTFIAGMLHSGQDNLASVTPGTGYEEVGPGQDYGAQTSHAQYKLAVVPAGSPVVNWTATTEEAGILAVAIRDGPISSDPPKHKFEFRSWPTSVRYDVTIMDKFHSPGSADGLFNQAMVRWRSTNNFTKHVQVLSPVAALTSAGRTRQALIDLGDEKGASENAIRVGQEYLSEHATPPNAGTLAISGQILDHDHGMMVMPWEIRPGHLIRVRGVLPRVDALNATSRDGVTVFKIVSVTYNANEATAELELDVPQRTVDQILAELVRAKQRRGRSIYPPRR